MFGPTEIRLLLIAGNVALLRSPYATVFGHGAAVRSGWDDCGGRHVGDGDGDYGAAYGAALPRGAAAVSAAGALGQVQLVGAMGVVVQLGALALFNRGRRALFDGVGGGD